MLLDNDISVNAFLRDVIAMMDCERDKANILYLYGMTNTGKTLLVGLTTASPKASF